MYSKKVMEYFLHPKNVGEIPDADGIGEVGNIQCLPPETSIEANSDNRAISTLKKGEKVLSHDGRYHEIKKIFRRHHHGTIIAIKNRLGETQLTPEHEVLAIKLPKTRRFHYTRNKKKRPPAWYPAGMLEKWDITLYPIMKERRDKRIILADNSEKKFDYKSKKIPEKIALSDDFMRLGGYYLAEGSLTDRVTSTAIQFSFSITEEELAADVIAIVKKRFGLKARKVVREEHNSIIVYVNSVMLVRLFKKLFGKGAENKAIPHFIMLLPPKKQKQLILGLWRGDGFFNAKKRAGYSTISEKLCRQLKTLLLRQGIIPSMYAEKEKEVKGVKHKKSYRIHVGSRDSLKKLSGILGIPLELSRPEANDAWCDENYVYTPITEVNSQKYSGEVYNLSIAETPTYVTNSLTVHNCGDIMRLYIKVKDGKIEDIKFRTFGCTAAIATSSMVTEMAKGKTIEEALKITNRQVADSLDGLPPIKHHCSLLAEEALSEAIYDYLKKTKQPIPAKLEERHAKAEKDKDTIEHTHRDYVDLQRGTENKK